MSHQKSIWTIVLLFMTFHIYGQNLPSLLMEKNINATFAVLAYDENAEEWGIAVATDNLYVGNSTIYIQPEVGAFAIIAETEPRYAFEGFEKLKRGKTIEASIREVKDTDEQAHYRQVAGIDAKGNVFAFTGKALKYWKGKASEILGTHYVVLGNQLNEAVLSNMSSTFENAKGTLAQRLLKSLVAGQGAGGQISGKQSAAVVVKGANNEWFNQIDLRVDHSQKPIEELQRLMDYHYGRIRLNQALYAHRAGKEESANKKLKEAETMLIGWTGIYAKIASVNAKLGNEDAAVGWVKRGLIENSNWSVNLSAFYFLRDHPQMIGLIDPATFSIKDWESAMSMLSNLGRELDVIALGKALFDQEIESSYLNFLLGRSYFYEKETNRAVSYLKKALIIDSENIEAEKLLSQIRSK